MRYVPKDISNVLDIGCDDGYLLNQISNAVARKIGIDPRLSENKAVNGAKIFKGYFPRDMCVLNDSKPYDVIFAVAVFEHFSTTDLVDSSKIMPSLLIPKGRLIITVPHPMVDRILEILIFLRFIKGQVTNEHHGFDPKDIVNYFGRTLKLIEHKRFQLGMNNVFVFERLR
jgi:2-polyprenyl-3-methyl-5-hydroxy-6-metoxy-1,4-benzoquinol methylase